jgi:hypothetical protein
MGKALVPFDAVTKDDTDRIFEGQVNSVDNITKKAGAGITWRHTPEG